MFLSFGPTFPLFSVVSIFKYAWFVNSSVHFSRNEPWYYLRVGVPLFVSTMYICVEKNLKL